MAETFWDNVFAKHDYHYGTEPNEWIRSGFLEYVLAGDGAPREVLVTELAAGEGRNAVWLAEQGCVVTAVDLSATGLEKARALAAQRGVAVQMVKRDVLGQPTDHPAAHVVVSTFFHVDPQRKRQLFHAHQALTRSGGFVIAEWFHPDQRAGGYSSGGPHDAAMLITPEEVRNAFAGSGWEILVCRRRERDLNEGAGHHGEAVVTQFIGRAG